MSPQDQPTEACRRSLTLLRQIGAYGYSDETIWQRLLPYACQFRMGSRDSGVNSDRWVIRSRDRERTARPTARWSRR